MSKPLQGKVAVVAGATRGAGRGIATALGGTVGVLSPVEGGRGARFTLRLPIGREAA